MYDGGYMEKYTVKIDFRAAASDKALIKAVKQRIEATTLQAATDSDAIRLLIRKGAEALGLKADE
jgi:hypothetical protein